MNMNTRAVLMRYETGRGYGSGSTLKASRVIYAAAEKPSLSFKAAMYAGNLAVSQVLHIWRDQFEEDGWTHVQIGEDVYRIADSGTSFNDLFVKLILSRD